MIDASKWLQDALRQTHKSQKGLATALGISESQTSRLVKGDRKLRLDEIPIVEQYFGMTFPQQGESAPIVPVLSRITPVRTIPVRVVVATGLWREKGSTIMDQTQVPASPDPRLASVEQYAGRVDGPEYGSFVGQYAVCVPYPALRLNPQDSDTVHVVRRRDDLEEHTLKVVHVRNGATLLAPLSPNGSAPTALTDDIEIVGLCVGMFSPFKF